MEMVDKTAQLFVVRNALGEFLGTYRRLTAAQAIQAFRDDQIAQVSAFRRSAKLHPLSVHGLTAKVEG